MRPTRFVHILALVGCAADAPATGPIDALSADAAPDGAPLPPRGTYRETCDGSGVVALDATHFIDVNDEDQVARVYVAGRDGVPTRAVDLTAALEVSAEADLEDAARVGDRIYVITSHGRTTSGNLKPDRYRFAALGTDLQRVGAPYKQLLADMLDAANWQTPDAQVIAALDASSQLDSSSEPNLAPELAGTNIEGLAALPDGTLAIGFRNPQIGGKAIVVTLVNADAVVTQGATAHFGHAVLVDLGGRGIRGMQWSEPRGAALVIAGPHDAAIAPFAVYSWDGVAATATSLASIARPADVDGNPEAILAEGRDARVIFDMGTDACKAAPAAQRLFRDTVVRLP